MTPCSHWSGYSQTLLAVADRCSRLQRHMYRRGFHVAAFHVPEHYWEAMARELWADPDDGHLRIKGVPILSHMAHRGIIAERGAKLVVDHG